VWAASSTDVFAVGDAGVILRRVNGVWTRMTSNTTNNLRGVWGTSSSNIWAVGQGGGVVHFNGTAWAAVSVSTTDMDGVWGSSASDVWIVGASTVWHSTNGTTFTSTAMAGALLSVHGTGPSDVWVSGENANLHHYASGKWTSVSPGAGTSTYYAVLDVSASSVWTSDFMPNKETMHYNGKSWAAAKTGNADFQSMFAMTATDLWGVGALKIGRNNGTTWTVTALTGITTSLWGVSGASGNVWAVGDAGVIEHYTY
jgi:hypothetical protein